MHLFNFMQKFIYLILYKTSFIQFYAEIHVFNFMQKCIYSILCKNAFIQLYAKIYIIKLLFLKPGG